MGSEGMYFSNWDIFKRTQPTVMNRSQNDVITVCQTFKVMWYIAIVLWRFLEIRWYSAFMRLSNKPPP